MCIIALKPEGVILPDYTLKTMWDGNPHGAGFMYSENGKLVIIKGLMTFEDFLGAYLEAGVERKMVMHFRIRTSGTNGPEMTHPFMVVSGLGMVHNGIITKMETTAEKSDTAVFAELLASEYVNPAEAVKNRFHREMIGAYIGAYNKLVFMDSDGNTTIVNESSGTWDGPVWYSNGGFRSYSRKVTTLAPSAECGSAPKSLEEIAEDQALAKWYREDEAADDEELVWANLSTQKSLNTPATGVNVHHGIASGERSPGRYQSREELWEQALREREETSHGFLTHAQAKAARKAAKKQRRRERLLARAIS